MLLPLAYAFTHWAYGGVSEYLARLVAAVMAVGAIGAAGALGREMRSVPVGLGAAGLVALTPVFCRWASSGYADVPAGFFLTLSALYAWRWWGSADRRDAVLTGLAAGLAMWTKNSALTLPVTLAALVVLRRRAPGPWRWTPVGLAVLAMVATAGPWYARNLLVFGFVVPPGTPWAHLAPRDLDALLVMARVSPQQFWVPGWLFTGAIAFGIWRLCREGAPRAAPWAVLLAFVLPFGTAWWALASYESRFLMAIVPLLAVMAALMLGDVGSRARRRLPAGPAARLGWAAALAVLALAPFSLRKAVEHKAVLLSDPALSDAGRHRLRLGGLYEVVRAVNGLPAGSRVVGLPSRARYHVEAGGLHFSGASASGLPADQVERYDYAVLRPEDREPPGWLRDRRLLLRTADGYALYALRDGP
jgi:4-amino-4-deoxy-L-arabinose transferase-like glycosyltransferase